MPSVVVNRPGDGEILVSGPATVRIMEDGTNTDHRLGLVEVTMPPNIGGPPQHLHRKHEESFYVVSGTMTFTSGTDVIEAGPGTLVTCPIGAHHTFANNTDQTVVVLCACTPDLYINYFREGASAAGAAETVPELMAHYATETVDN